LEHSIYLKGLKTALRAQSVTYCDLAERMKMTESGVKKMLNAKDISFRRILQICEILQILPGELLSLSEKAYIPEVNLSVEQEQALLQNRFLLAVYWRFVVEKKALEDIQSLQKMTMAELKKIMHRLVDLKLIAYRRKEFRPLIQGKFRWSDESKLAIALNKEWSLLTLKRALDRSSFSEKKLHRLIAMNLTHESYQKLLVQISSILDEAVLTADRESLSAVKTMLRPVTVLAAAVPYGFLDAE